MSRSESVGDECLSESSNDACRKPCTDSRRSSSRSVRQHDRNSGDVSEIKNELNASADAAKHLRQYSDSVVDSGTCVDDLCDNLNAASGAGNEGEARDAITRLEPRGPLLTFHRAGAPYRSASFGQVDFNQGNPSLIISSQQERGSQPSFRLFPSARSISGYVASCASFYLHNSD